MSTGFITACEHLLSATANSLYQGILIALLAAFILRLFGRTNAATRHAVWFGTLLLVAALIPAHLLLSSLRRTESCATTARQGEPATTAALEPTPTVVTTVSPGMRLDSPASQSIESSDSTKDTLSVFIAGSQDELADVEISPDVATAQSFPMHPTQELQKPASRKFEAFLNLPNSICLGLVSAWILFASVRAGKIAFGLADVLRTKATSRVPRQSLQILFDRLRDSLGVRRRVRLRISDSHRTAVVLGFFHPAIMLPTDTDDHVNSDEVEAVLRHELAHVARRDDWANLMQQLIQCALFFHPAVWWIGRRLALEREIACDDHVLQANGRPHTYALTLANIASRVHQSRQLLAPGVSNNNSQLKQRINMILNTRRNRSPRLARSRFGIAAMVTALLAVVAITAGPRLVLAQSTPVDAATGLPGNNPPAPKPFPAPGVTAALPPDWSGDETDPRSKPFPPGNHYAPAAPMPAPAARLALPPVAASGYAPAAPPVVRLAQAESMQNVTPMPMGLQPPHASKKPMSVEERLDRIERMLEKLDARNGFIEKTARGGLSYGVGGGVSTVTGTKPLYTYSYSTADATKAELDAKRAAEAGQRAYEQASRNFEQLAKTADLERLQKNLHEMEAKGWTSELEALRKARESLRQEMESMDRQIKQLEKSADQLKKRGRSRDDSDEDAKPDKPAAR